MSFLFFRLLLLAILGSANLSLIACSKDTINTTPTPSTFLSETVTQNTPLPKSSKQISLLVPLQGSLGNIGQAIKQGFLAAASQDNTSTVHVTVIDTQSASSIQATYHHALEQKAQFIVGPLLKSQVQTIASLQPSTPVLALNYLDPDINPPPQFYQFGLSPLDEAQEAVQLAWQKGSRSALIITSKNNWGLQIGQIFKKQWQALGGKVAGKLILSSNPLAITQQMRQFLRFIPPHHRRTDFDVIFLASNPQTGRQIKPLLQFFYAGEVPVYATAAIYSKSPHYKRLDRDLEQIIFCTAPWELGIEAQDTSLYEQLQAHAPQRFKSYSPYYALGVDAFHLVQQLPRLMKSPEEKFAGATGLLSLIQPYRIVRQLPCAQFHHGNVVLLSN